MEQPTTDNNLLYSRPVLDFITVAAEFCKCLENCGEMERRRFSDVMRSLLPMIYLKANLLPEVAEMPGFNAQQMTEADYNFVRTSIAAVLGEEDDYLDVFVSDFKYSDTPVLCTVSEDLADVYQYLREVVEVFRQGHEEAMTVALREVIDAFGESWGQKTLNALRALHDARYGGNNAED